MLLTACSIRRAGKERTVKDFKDKVLFITGGASGAGLGQAKVFSEAGCRVVIADVRQDHLDEAMASPVHPHLRGEYV